ncbi:MAG: DUF1080 domain-containing protein [Fimbriimonadaceae bacterium]|nr:DUF1080 domain-containing protein [Fimbriimonadaceae bacterium]
MRVWTQWLVVAAALGYLGVRSVGGADAAWVDLFNGRDLTGWTPKITGQPLGEDKFGTFRVTDGALAVGYEKYDGFKNQFGHIFYEKPFSRYRFRCEYRFVGEQCPGGPGWALRNSGVMIHCQQPETMTVGQSFPVSIEVQLLGGNGKDARHTGNLCTPGTNIVMGGQLVTRHCTDSSSETFHGEQWVTCELEVHGDQVIRHLINGVEVLRYEQAQLDPNDGDAKRLIQPGQPLLLRGGYVSLQSESHPVQFRRIQVLELAD